MTTGRSVHGSEGLGRIGPIRHEGTAAKQWRALELSLTAILLVLSFVYVAQFLRSMARAPLSNDELFSVLNYSSRGPWTSLTKYNNPNNHVFLNLLNSLLPGAHSLNPLRERWWSMVALVTMQLLVLYEFFRRKWYLPGALLSFVFAVNFNWLDEMLQDRGYGILGLCAMAASLWLWRYLDTGQRRWLVGMAVVTLIGAWTVPSFVFFAAPLWLLLLATDRSRRVLYAGVATLLAILVVYAPLASQLWHQATTYSNSWGREFGTLTAPFSTFWSYLFDHHHLQGQHLIAPRLRDRSSALAVVWLVALVAPLLVILPRAERAPRWLFPMARDLVVSVPHTIRDLVRVLVGASAALFAIALILQTPPQRTVAFVVVPVAVATVVSIGALLADRRVGPAATGFVSITALLACLLGAFVIPSFSYTPIENWSGAASFVESTFPDHMVVMAVTRGRFLAAYLDSASHPVVGRLDTAKFERGEVIVDDYDPLGNLGAFRQRLTSLDRDLAEMDLPQRLGLHPPGAFPILIAPPLEPGLGRISVDGVPEPQLADRRLATGYTSPPQDRLTAPITMRMDVVLQSGVRSLIMVVGPGTAPAHLVVRVTGPDARQVTVPPSDVSRSAGMVAVELGDRPITSIELVISRSSSPRPFSPRELWVYGP